ncbi:gamma-glutamylcyclotransferase [Novosphingobium sp. NDB2Meth1]|nr:gamma-glutamylcyclotransferase [Novosphingobium sp. NDB2Meth1]
MPAHWDRLDAFEGDEYRRGEVMVETAEGRVAAWIYLAAE